MKKNEPFRIRYWGVRGSTPAPLSSHAVSEKIIDAVFEMVQTGLLEKWMQSQGTRDELRDAIHANMPFHLRSTYGGDTTCIEIETPNELLIVDCGSGIRALGVDLNRRWNAPDYQGPREAHILITHAHIDHTAGLPFFDPLYDPRNAFTILAPQSVVDGIRAVLDPNGSLCGVYVAPALEVMRGIRAMRAIDVNAPFTIGDTRVATFALNHPGGCVAYRFDRDDRRVVFASDHEHHTVPDRDLAEFAEDADLLYMDAQYYEQEYRGNAALPGDSASSKEGWGHSGVESAVATAVCARAKVLHLGHHDPKRTDAALHELNEYARSLLANNKTLEMHVDTVHEGLSITL